MNLERQSQVPSGAGITADQVVSLLVGSDRIRLSGFNLQEQVQLPLWLPSVKFVSPAAVAVAVQRNRRFLRLLKYGVGLPLLVIGACTFSFFAGRALERSETHHGRSELIGPVLVEKTVTALQSNPRETTFSVAAAQAGQGISTPSTSTVVERTDLKQTQEIKRNEHHAHPELF